MSLHLTMVETQIKKEIESHRPFIELVSLQVKVNQSFFKLTSQKWGSQLGPDDRS